MNYFQEIANELLPRSVCSSRNIIFVFATEKYLAKSTFNRVLIEKKTVLKVYRHLRVRNRIKMWKNILRFVLKKHTKVD